MIAIQKATANDIDAIVRIHEAAFPDFFLTSLGAGFLKLFYTSVMNHKDGVLLVCENEERVIGFCAGTMLSSGFNSKLIKANIWAYMLASLRILFTRPMSLVHLMKNMSSNHYLHQKDHLLRNLLAEDLLFQTGHTFVFFEDLTILHMLHLFL